MLHGAYSLVGRGILDRPGVLGRGAYSLEGRAGFARRELVTRVELSYKVRKDIFLREGWSLPSGTPIREFG
jgi:hypothetical protein